MTYELPKAVLVATDFSEASRRALETALALRKTGAEITVVHVLDDDLAGQIGETGLADHDTALARMREAAENEMARLAADVGEKAFESLIVVGIPFAEIVKIAHDLDVDWIVMAVRSASPELRTILFGGTAEKVLRGTNLPVLCVP